MQVHNGKQTTVSLIFFYYFRCDMFARFLSSRLDGSNSLKWSRFFGLVSLCLVTMICTVFVRSVSGQETSRLAKYKKSVEDAARQLGGFKTSSDSEDEKRDSADKKHDERIELVAALVNVRERWESKYSIRLTQLASSDSLHRKYGISEDQLAELKLLTRDWPKPEEGDNHWGFDLDDSSSLDASILPPDLDIPFTAGAFRPEKTEENRKNLMKIIGPKAIRLIDRDSFQVGVKVNYDLCVQFDRSLTKIFFPALVLSRWKEINLDYDRIFDQTIEFRKKLIEENRNQRKLAYKRILKLLPTKTRKKLKSMLGNEKTPVLEDLALGDDEKNTNFGRFKEMEPILIFDGLLVDRDYTHGLELTADQIHEFLPKLKKLRKKLLERLKQPAKESWQDLWAKDSEGGANAVPKESNQKIEFTKEIKEFAEKFKKILNTAQIRRLRQMNVRSFCYIQAELQLFWPIFLADELKLSSSKKNEIQEAVIKELRDLADRYKKQDEKYFEQIVKGLPKKTQKDLRNFLKPIQKVKSKNASK